jgi:uncharacterized protein
MLAVVLGLSVFIGLALGLLGGGGSILTVPILVYAAGIEAKEAIAMSLLVVGVTSAAGVVAHARSGRVRWRTGLIFGAAGMAGAYGGGRLGEFIPATWLLVGFAVMMLATAAAMIRGRRQPAAPATAHKDLPVLHVIAEGAVVGLVTGLVGAGGGFLVVPALVLLGGLPMNVAVGTSLLVIAMKSGAGLAGYLHSVSIDWGLAAAVTAAAIVGSVAGGRLAGHIPETRLRKGFGWFVVAMGLFVLGQQVPSDLRAAILGSPATWVVVTVVVVSVTAMAARGRVAGRGLLTGGGSDDPDARPAASGVRELGAGRADGRAPGGSRRHRAAPARSGPGGDGGTAVSATGPGPGLPGPV